jgi:tetratricopeptide (TPR) repeat protein
MTAARKHRDHVETGLAHHRAGRLDKAEAAYKRALAKDGKDAAALHLSGLVAADKGRPGRALQLINKALALAPDSADFLHSAGHVLSLAGRPEDAVAHYQAALAQAPDRPLTLSNLGNALKRLGRLDEAARRLARAVAIDPGFAEGWSNLGLVQKERGLQNDARDAFARAIALRPDEAGFHYNLANAELEAGNFEAAITGFAKTLEQDPAHGRARMNLATALKSAGDVTGAIAEIEAALMVLPVAHHDHAEAHWNLGLNLLMAGDWARGWAEFEWRRKMPGYGPDEIDAPEWTGGSLVGRRILINHEQGMGDAFQFMGFAGDLAERGAQVIYRGPKALGPVIGCMKGVGETIAFEDPLPHIDAWVPMMSLPRLLGLVDAAALSRTCTLAPDSSFLAPYGARLAAAVGLKVGICWQGNPNYKADAGRSIPLRAFAGLARSPGVTLVALQKGAGAEQVGDWPVELPLVNFGGEIDGAGGAFMETAAVIQALDLVVGSDTALVHLAGALGADTHVALARVPDWRWGLEGVQSVWYPTMTLHRQSRSGDWDSVFQGISRAVERRLADHG